MCAGPDADVSGKGARALDGRTQSALPALAGNPTPPAPPPNPSQNNPDARADPRPSAPPSRTRTRRSARTRYRRCRGASDVPHPPRVPAARAKRLGSGSRRRGPLLRFKKEEKMGARLASTAAPTRTRSRSSVPPTRRTSAGARDRRPIPIPTMTSGPRSSDAPARGRSPRLSTNHRRESTRRRRL